jgi:hypothetical protein
MQRAEGMFNLNRFDGEAPYGPDGGHSYTLDYEF